MYFYYSAPSFETVGNLLLGLFPVKTYWAVISRYWEIYTECGCDRVIQYADAVGRVVMKQIWRLNLCDKKHMLADLEVWCVPMLSGSIVPSHCWFRDRVGLPPLPQAQSLDNSMPYHINIFMNADDGWGCGVHFCGERICYQVFIYRVIREESQNWWGGGDSVGHIEKKVHMNLKQSWKGDSQLKHNRLTSIPPYGSPRQASCRLHIPACGLYVGRYPPQPVSVLWPAPTLSPYFLLAQAIFQPDIFLYNFIFLIWNCKFTIYSQWSNKQMWGKRQREGIVIHRRDSDGPHGAVGSS